MSPEAQKVLKEVLELSKDDQYLFLQALMETLPLGSGETPEQEAELEELHRRTNALFSDREKRKEQIAAYKELLQTEWGPESLEDCHILLQSFGIEVESVEFTPEWGDFGSNQKLARDLYAGVLIAEKTEDLFLRDVVSMFANMAVDLLWEPDVHGKGWVTLLRFAAERIYEDDPARRYALEGEVFDALGDHDAALTSWLKALELTLPDEPDYLSHVHTVWYAYKEHGRDSDAQRFLDGLPAEQREQFLKELAGNV